MGRMARDRRFSYDPLVWIEFNCQIRQWRWMTAMNGSFGRSEAEPLSRQVAPAYTS
jgi:hypothetical protein